MQAALGADFESVKQRAYVVFNGKQGEEMRQYVMEIFGLTEG